jgi:hypothetical protein
LRTICVLVILAGLANLTGCGSTSASPPVSLTPAVPQLLTEGQTLDITAVVGDATNQKGVTWSLNPSTGSLSNQTSTSVVYQAPDAVTSNFTVTLTATSMANSSETAPLVITVLAPGQQNVQPVAVNGGPLVEQTYINGPFTTVLICVPGTSNCQSIDGILVDTGSPGLRLFTSVLGLPLPRVTQSGGTVNDCIHFGGQQFFWGEVASADVYLAGESAKGISIQIVEDPTSFSIPTSCSNGLLDGADHPTFSGVLGIDTEPTDCTSSGSNSCDPSSGVNPHPPYYVCFDGQGCASTLVPKAQQVVNPIIAFGQDNNGSVLEFPAVGTAMASVAGTLTFGINTQLNNNIGSATVYAVSNSSFTTVFANQDLTNSFLDSGSPDLFFPNITGIPLCSDDVTYCPPSPLMLTAQNEGVKGVGSGTVNFQIDNFGADLADNPGDAVFGYLGIDNSQSTTCQNGQGACMFDWGLPFFYGRKVFTSIDTQTVANQPSPPWWAY